MDKNFRNFIFTVIVFLILASIHIALNTVLDLPYKLNLIPLIIGAGLLVLLFGIVFLISVFLDSYKIETKYNTIIQDSTYLDGKYNDLLEKYDNEFYSENNKQTIEEAKKLLRDKLENISTESYFQEIRNTIRTDIVAENFENKIKNIESRVQREIGRLSKSGIINLSLGMMLSIGGIVYLGSFIINVQAFNSLENMFVNTFPKAVFVLLIEVFAYFFLKLYKQNLDDIKYYQNELTNIESKNLAIQIAKQSNNHKLVTLCVEELLSTERNFILEKDQSTIEIEKERINSNNTNNTLQVLKDIFKNKV